MAEMTDVACEDCGAIFPMIVGSAERRDQNTWYPGKKCPICGSAKFLPVVKTVEAVEKPLAKWKVDRRVGIAAGIVAGVFLIIGFVWYLHERPRRQAGVKALYVCEVCKERFLASVSGKVPKKCPKCKGRTGYRAVQCLNCYEVYPAKTKDWAKDPPTCPKCKSTLSQILRDFSDIRKKPAKKPEGEPGKGEKDGKEEGVHPD
jgi:Zn finger protein HypA/HybF involved in hydrogenase expression